MTAAFLSLNLMFLFPFGQGMESFFLEGTFPSCHFEMPQVVRYIHCHWKTSWLYKSIIYLGLVHRASHFMDWTYQKSQRWQRTNPRYNATKRLEPFSFSYLKWNSPLKSPLTPRCFMNIFLPFTDISPIAFGQFLVHQDEISTEQPTWQCPRWLSLSCWNLWRIHVALWPTYLWSKDDDCCWWYYILQTTNQN